jgi:AraC-like DNA-binding protein
MKLLGFASIPAVLQYLRYAASQQLDTLSAIVASGIDPNVLDNANGRIPGEQFQNLIKALLGQSDDPLMGLHTGLYVQPGSYSVLGYISMSCATIGDAIERIPPYERLVGDMGTTRIERTVDTISLNWRCAYTDPLVRMHMIDNVLASWTGFARWLADQDTSPDKILLQRPAPKSLTEIKEYESYFRCPIFFNQDKSAVVLRRSLLGMPLRQPDQRLLKTLESHASQQINELESKLGSFSLRVMQVVRKQLSLGQIRKELVADELGVSLRTLQRKLLAEGAQYQTLADEVRLELAKECLLESKLALQDIAYNLGFSDSRSFHRRFKQWTGKTPGEFRRQNITDINL